MADEKKKIVLSASRLKTLSTCSYIYYANYILKLRSPGNSGSSRGTCVHLIFQVLLNPRHKHHFDKIIEANDIKGSPAVYQLTLKTAKKLNVSDKENMEMINDMILVGLKNNFHPKGAAQVSAEEEFTIEIDDKISINGFIDKKAIFPDGTIKITDYKSSKKQFEQEELDGNMQSLMYSLACHKQHKTIPTVDFNFLRFPENPIQSTPKVKESELSGFISYLKYIGNYLLNFGENEAKTDYAADDPNRRWLCGYTKYKDEPKKDGTPKWYCFYKYPFDYWALLDKNGNVVKTAYKEGALESKEGYRIEKRRFGGCPKFNTPAPVKKEDVWDW